VVVKDVLDALDTDTQTLRDGSLNRILRARKWMVATSVALFVMQGGWWDDTALRHALGLDHMPSSAWRSAASVFGAYLTVQGGLMLVQYWLLETADRKERIEKAIRTVWAGYGSHIRIADELVETATALQQKSIQQELSAKDIRRVRSGLMSVRLVRGFYHLARDASEGLIRGTEALLDTMRVWPAYIFLVASVFGWSDFSFIRSWRTTVISAPATLATPTPTAHP
jgi:hypothetical protein